MTDFLRIPGVVCPCGSDQLRVIAPGSDGDGCDLFALRRPVADKGWCGIACATQAGWPWVRSGKAA